MKNLFYILIILALATACKKKSMVVIQAQNINNTADGSHYTGMAYGIVENWTPVFDLKSKSVAQGVLDANGHAAFELKMKANRRYYLGIQTPDNVCYTEITLQESLDHEKNNTFNFNYAPCGELSIPSKNINCEGIDDKMQMKYYYTNDPNIYIYSGFTTGANYEWDDQPFIEGCADYTNVVPPAIYSRPTGNYTVEWRVIRPSGTTTGIDYFTITEGETLTYVLEY